MITCRSFIVLGAVAVAAAGCSSLDCTADSAASKAKLRAGAYTTGKTQVKLEWVTPSSLK